MGPIRGDEHYFEFQTLTSRVVKWSVGKDKLKYEQVASSITDVFIDALFTLAAAGAIRNLNRLAKSFSPLYNE